MSATATPFSISPRGQASRKLTEGNAREAPEWLAVAAVFEGV